MNKVRGKILKKLKSVRPVGYLRQAQDRVLQVNSSDGCKSSVLQEHSNNLKVLEPDIIDVSDLRDDYDDDDKENVGPPQKECSVSETEDEQSGSDEAESTHIDVSSFRRPKLSSRSLFDPKLLSAFRRAVKEHIKLIEAERRARTKEAEQEPPLKARRIEETEQDPLLGFPENCPPGGDGGVIFYTTSLRGIRKTFENCNSVRFLLETFRVKFIERDVSMHAEFREELRRVVSGVPPKLFVKGRYVGGAEEVLRLHEQGKLRPLFEGVPVDRSEGPCGGCAGVKFLVCFHCSGSRRRVSDDGLWAVCEECNENGLLVCPVCC